MRQEALRRLESDDSDDGPKSPSPPPRGNSTWKSDSVASRSKGRGSKDESKDDSKGPTIFTQDLGNPLYNEQLAELNNTREKLFAKVGKSPTGEVKKKRTKKNRGKGAGDDGLSVYSLGTTVQSGQDGGDNVAQKTITQDYGIWVMGQPRNFYREKPESSIPTLCNLGI